MEEHAAWYRSLSFGQGKWHRVRKVIRYRLLSGGPPTRRLSGNGSLLLLILHADHLTDFLRALAPSIRTFTSSAMRRKVQFGVLVDHSLREPADAAATARYSGRWPVGGFGPDVPDSKSVEGLGGHRTSPDRAHTRR